MNSIQKTTKHIEFTLAIKIRAHKKLILPPFHYRKI